MCFFIIFYMYNTHRTPTTNRWFHSPSRLFPANTVLIGSNIFLYVFCFNVQQQWGVQLEQMWRVSAAAVAIVVDRWWRWRRGWWWSDGGDDEGLISKHKLIKHIMFVMLLLLWLGSLGVPWRRRTSVKKQIGHCLLPWASLGCWLVKIIRLISA